MVNLRFSLFLSLKICRPCCTGNARGQLARADKMGSRSCLINKARPIRQARFGLQLVHGWDHGIVARMVNARTTQAHTTHAGRPSRQIPNRIWVPEAVTISPAGTSHKIWTACSLFRCILIGTPSAVAIYPAQATVHLPQPQAACACTASSICRRSLNEQRLTAVITNIKAVMLQCAFKNMHGVGIMAWKLSQPCPRCTHDPFPHYDYNDRNTMRYNAI